jgi:gliding motility-associated-like protein
MSDDAMIYGTRNRTEVNTGAVTINNLIDAPSLLNASDGISADGDSINDAFIIENIELFPENTVQIFNRWGVQVFETNGYDNNDTSNSKRFVGISNGRTTISQGDHLPTGTYYYIITYAADDGVTRNKSGYLYLNR